MGEPFDEHDAAATTRRSPAAKAVRCRTFRARLTRAECPRMGVLYRHFHGVISNVRDGSTLILKVDDNCKIEVDKTAIATIDRGTAATPKR